MNTKPKYLTWLDWQHKAVEFFLETFSILQFTISWFYQSPQAGPGAGHLIWPAAVWCWSDDEIILFNPSVWWMSGNWTRLWAGFNCKSPPWLRGHNYFHGCVIAVYVIAVKCGNYCFCEQSSILPPFGLCSIKSQSLQRFTKNTFLHDYWNYRSRYKICALSPRVTSLLAPLFKLRSKSIEIVSSWEKVKKGSNPWWCEQIVHLREGSFPKYEI